MIGSLDSGKLAVLHALRLCGFVDEAGIALRTGYAEGDVRRNLDTAAASGEAMQRTGRLNGWTLTPAGREVHAALLSAQLEESGAQSVVEAADADFVALNYRFKELCLRWQILPGDIPNDHNDAEYDALQVAELANMHGLVVAIIRRFASQLTWFGRYEAAFEAALNRVQIGDLRAFTTPLAESYHDVWMELHQDLMSRLGRKRNASDGS